MHNSLEIANEFIKRSLEDNNYLTQMQLQKLVYIAHGWNLAINDAALTIDSPKAFNYGPVYNELYDCLKRNGSKPIKEYIKRCDTIASGFSGVNEDEILEADLTDNEKKLIDKIYDVYGKYHAFQLSAMTHVKGTPWDIVYNEKRDKYAVIPNDIIKDHFNNLPSQ